MEKRFWRYWGKARKEGEGGTPYHLLPYHSLDVAAVGVTFLRRTHRLRSFLANFLGLDETILVALFGFFLALHDLGKFSERFQGQRPDILKRLQSKTSSNNYTVRHDSLGFAYWQQCLWPQLQPLSAFATFSNHTLEYWASAVMGHHGKPPILAKSVGQGFILTDHFFAEDRLAAAEFAEDVRHLFLTEHLEKALSTLDPKTFAKASRALSWWLAGLAVLADWLGSNQDFFPYRSDEWPLEKYWDSTLNQAESAVAATDLLPIAVAPSQQPETLFEFLKTGLTPLQMEADRVPLASGPQLFVLEDVTGAGKTEAAVILSQRLMAAGLADSVYFALPTMATSNAMYVRIAPVYNRLFAATAKPSLVLAHGAAHLSDGFQSSILPFEHAVEDERLNATDESASARCNAWFADNRKKALLAHVGVGTVDQALLAVLHSKHQSLRVLGLFGKLLIVDEVHACDAYMLGLLNQLLTLQARAGGSAILLSATLPLASRQQLADAFRRGLGAGIQSLQSDAYPLLTQISDSPIKPNEIPLGTRPEVARSVRVELQAEEASVWAALHETLAAGGCACWIRNTVADALETHARVLDDERFDPARVHLFHARFTTGDRICIEDAMLQRFGKDSGPTERAGQLVIATQVVEQSLDVDFDLLVSDLAPIDLLIQRAGRLQRHARDEQGNLLPARQPDRRGGAQLIVFGPLPDSEVGEDWYQGFFPKGAAVYPNHGQLWLTAKRLADQQGFRMPEDARALIEGVYGPEADQAMPGALLGKHFDAEAGRLVQQSAVKHHAIRLDAGYQADEETWWEDRIALTRLGEETHTLRLARWREGQLLPWHEGEDGWHLSEVRVRQALVMDAVIEDAALRNELEKLKPSLPGKGRWSVLLPLIEADGAWRCDALNGKKRRVKVSYSERSGLSVEP
ncbi:CRISPR-associated helicase/endonuclease Cas3 [Methylocaldum sp. RMAD-M]|jgi:CRISPR-associated endonuclease/helicase Cas3|uniref:CRISPR-associated helicase/endonuclease Cas3 n=1 Tax=unclassified Methylocaldum TaxID=2622260 RepID=UPI000A320707|nr:CRISPR-associated helicase/endonuclease Cas3 [Methylocaldum sp. RMAD-M]MBP1148348.1 CRISPR-associated endonuclease/helicase Cas3 [Methylocaldum sp. RMAD-M]